MRFETLCLAEHLGKDKARSLEARRVAARTQLSSCFCYGLHICLPAVRQIAQKRSTLRPGNERFGSTAEVGDLFDHLVGQQLERVRHGEAEGGGGLEINDQFVFERELNGQIARI